MSRLLIYSMIFVAAVFVSSVSQLMLKKSAKKQYDSRIKEYLNPLVITAYVLFFITTLVPIYTLKVIPLSMSPILDSTSYIFITVLSAVFLKEKPKKKQVIGIITILMGIAVYSVQL